MDPGLRPQTHRRPQKAGYLGNLGLHSACPVLANRTNDAAGWVTPASHAVDSKKADKRSGGIEARPDV